MSNPGPPATTIATRQTHRPRVLAVITDDCTGCNTCVDYCLVDCIEPASPDRNLSSSSLVTIREDECIGCVVCAKVCEELGVNAIHLVPAVQTD
jgi:NAD-dependent dihydropyrimidine dehydrogenase PreA subunit